MSGEINVISRTQKIVVNPTTRSVAVINAGPSGSAGIGVPTGGTTGQVLTKDTSTDYDTSWQTPVDPPLKLDNLTDVQVTGIPTNGQVLKFESASGLWKPGVDESGASGGGLPPGGVIYDLLVKASSTDGHATWTKAPQVTTLTADSIAIRDPVGATYPKLGFTSGDGDNGTGPNTYGYDIRLYNDRLWIYSSRQSGYAIASFSRPAVDKAIMTLHDWSIVRDTDGYLRFYCGSDLSTGANDFTIGEGGNIWSAGVINANIISASGAATINGGVFSPWYTQTPILQAAAGTALLMRATTYAEVQALGTFGSPQVGVSIGNQYGVGTGPTVSLYAFPNGNQYYQRQLTLNKIGGGGECGMAFINNVTGNIGCFQLHNDGSPYIGFLNSGNSGYIKSYASAFTVNSSRRFKAELQRFGNECRYVAMDIVRKVVPVRYRDLQHELAMEVLAPYPDGTTHEPVEVEPNYRFGLIAEEVEESAPELVSHTPDHGPGVDLSGLIGVLWQAVRELSDELQGVRRELADIRGYPQ